MTTQASQLIREGQYAAEVSISLHDDGGEWGPTVAPDDIRKLDRVRAALRTGDLAGVEREAQLFRLVPYRPELSAPAGLAETEQNGYEA